MCGAEYLKSFFLSGDGLPQTLVIGRDFSFFLSSFKVRLDIADNKNVYGYLGAELL